MIDNIENIDFYLDGVKIDSDNLKHAMLYLQEGDFVHYDESANLRYFAVGGISIKLGQGKAQWRVVSSDDLGKPTVDRKNIQPRTGSAGAIDVWLELAEGTIEINDEPSRIVLSHTLKGRTFSYQNKTLQLTRRLLYAVEGTLGWFLGCTNVGV